MDIKVTETFEKEIINLKKRFINIDRDFENLLQQLINNPKSGGYRVITYLIENKIIYLITIYYKSDRDTITDDEILEIAKKEKLI